MSGSDNPQRSQQAGQRSRQARGWTVKRRDAPIRQMIVPGQVARSQLPGLCLLPLPAVLQCDDNALSVGWSGGRISL